MMPTSPAPSAGLFLSHLGLPLETIAQAVFDHADEPDFSLPSHSPIGGIFFKRAGFSITFCPPDFYHANDMLAGQPPIVTNVQLYAGDGEYRHARYADALPFGLSFEDGRESVIGKLGQAAWRHPFVEPFELERFDLLDRWMLVKYADNMSRISVIQIGLKHKKPKPTVLPKILQPGIAALESMFGKEWREAASHPAFQGIDLSGFGDESAGGECPHEVDALQTHGVELYFRPSKTSDTPCSVLTGARYIRKGVYWSAGFDGALPRGIRFEDAPEVFLARIGRLPDTGKADTLTGHYIWKLPEYLLQIGFSVMEQRINRVYVAAHSYYSTALLEAPVLAHPRQAPRP